MARIKRPRPRTSSSAVRALRAIVIVLGITFLAILLRQGDAWHKHTAKHRQHATPQAMRNNPATALANHPRVAFTLANLKGEPSEGEIVIETVAAWAPLGVAHFWDLVGAGYYDQVRFFRVLPSFVAQFGIASDPSTTTSSVWKHRTIADDPVRQTNAVGTVTFATSGKDARTTQLFFNLHDNANLDREGFSPIGRITEGMDNVYRIQDEHREEPDQQEIQEHGNAYLQDNFPSLSYIKSVRVL